MTKHPIQLFDADSSTFTYILPAANGEAAIIDPVSTQYERDLQQLERMDLKLSLILETHAHADHVTSAGRLAMRTGARTATPSGCGMAGADVQLNDGDEIILGLDEKIGVLHTPGHTAGSVCFVWHDNVFTGDTLLINGCGRTDFQGGNPELLYQSIHRKLFVLPPFTLVWPGHDYHGQSVTSIGWEKSNNKRLAGYDKESFTILMNNLSLPRPKLIKVAVSANRLLGMPEHSRISEKG